MLKKLLWLCLRASHLLNLYRVDANVIGIDLGSDAFKVAIVQPGSPLDIVTNFQSKRKTPLSISFYRDERMFGSDSIALMARKPELTLSKVYRVLGKPVDHPLVQELSKQYFPHEIYTNETTGFTCFKQDEKFYTPEELMAMIMQHIKDMTLNHGGKVIKDCVITVPSHFTYHERKALYTAADIADLRVLTLIEENTAAALHFGMDRVFETPNTIIFYNMGSSSVQVTIVTYSSYTVKEAGKNKTIGQFDVIGKAWDSSLGGFFFDVKLAELLAKRFNEVWNKKPKGKGKDIRDFNRPMTRLRVEAVKVKEVLSANNEYPVKAEQLHDDVDLITKVTRNDFEAECSDLFARITDPIDRALAMANITLSDVNSVELLGGGVRIPKVKKLLDDYFKVSKLELGQHLNGDEAMALGAAFRGANLSTSFKVRKVGQSDISMFGVSVNLETLPTIEEKGGKGGLFSGMFGKKETVKASSGDKAVTDDKENEIWSKHTELFPTKYMLSSKLKTVTFPYDKDILCRIQYSDPSSLPSGTDATIAVYNITGISKFATEAISKNASIPKVHLSFSQDSDGLINLVRAEITTELPLIVDEISPKNDTTSEENSQSDDTVNKENNVNDTNTSTTEDENTTTTTTNSTKSGKGSKSSSSKKDKKAAKRDTILRRTLDVMENLSATKPAQWTPENIAESRAKLHALQAADDARRAKEAALNDLEAYIYKVKNRFEDEEAELEKVSTPEQRKLALDAAKEAEEWLEDANSQTTTKQEYTDKRASISTKTEPIFYRLSELINRPIAIKKAQTSLSQIKSKVLLWPEKMPQITEKETENMLETIQTAENWLETKQEEQLATNPSEAPVFASADVNAQIKPVTLLYEKLNRKPKPPPEKVIKVNVNNTNATADSNNNETEVKEENVNEFDDDATASTTNTDETMEADSSEEDSIKKEARNSVDDEL